MKRIRIGTLCSGIGSPETAAEEMGISFTVEFASDIDTDAKTTYLANHRCKRFYNNIYDISEDVPKTDLMVVGFPCQPFSLAAVKAQGLEDERGKLIYKICEVIHLSSPRYFIAENVEGLIKRNGGETLKSILALFESIGYKVQYKVLNSLDFGVPQHRKRVYFVGIKQGDKKDFNFSSLSLSSPPPLRKILDRRVNKRFYATASFLGKDKVKRRLNNYFKDYAPCVTKTIARNGSSSEYISQVAAVNRAIGQKRKPTPRECARLHGFPESFILPDNVSVTKLYEQFANTMSVPVVGAVLNELL